jgi:hypothetical protein
MLSSDLINTKKTVATQCSVLTVHTVEDIFIVFYFVTNAMEQRALVAAQLAKKYHLSLPC